MGEGAPGALGQACACHRLAYRRARLATGSGLSEYSFESFDAELSALRASHGGDAGPLALLDKLQQWRQELEAGL